MKKKYYRLDTILTHNADYNILLGERTNGKSFAVKEYCLIKAYEENEGFAYLRRWQEDVKNDTVSEYFDDENLKIEKITNGEFNAVKCIKSVIYFCNINKDGIVERKKRCGKAFRLSGESHYKSLSFTWIKNLIFEEVITDDGYLGNEPRKLLSLVSTIARREKIRCFLIANTISRFCPYFSEWQLTGIKKQKPNSIDIYNYHTTQEDENGIPIIIKIAVELCDNINSGKMFFGNSENMINGGQWDVHDMPHLEKKHNEYRKHYTCLIEHENYRYAIEILSDNIIKVPFIYVYPYTKENIDRFNRIVSDKYMIDRRASLKLTEFNKYDRIIVEAVKLGRVRFSDNLTGTEFYQLIKNKGGL